MDPITADLLRYYDQEAQTRAARGLDRRRQAWQDRFVELLAEEGRTDLLEVGCGPGRDGPGFRRAGLTAVGIDLSARSARLATDAGLPALQGSLYDLPVRPERFHAAWTMSTLVHVPDRRFDRAMSQICGAVQPGGPVGIGLWGGVDHEGLGDADRFDPPRFFSARTNARVQAMLGRFGTVERFEVQDYGLDNGWIYQFAVLRLP